MTGAVRVEVERGGDEGRREHGRGAGGQGEGEGRTWVEGDASAEYV